MPGKRDFKKWRLGFLASTIEYIVVLFNEMKM